MFLCPWESPGKNIGVGVLPPPPENLPDPGIEPATTALADIFFTNEPPGKPPKE